MTNHVSVICVNEEGIVCEHKLFIGSKKAVRKAELCFTKKMKELNTEVDKDLIEEALDNGYYQYNGCTVVISWPEIKK